jgi:hypothetical protein
MARNLHLTGSLLDLPHHLSMCNPQESPFTDTWIHELDMEHKFRLGIPTPSGSPTIASRVVPPSHSKGHALTEEQQIPRRYVPIQTVPCRDTHLRRP